MMFSTASLYRRTATSATRSAFKTQSITANVPSVVAVRTFANDPAFGSQGAMPMYSPTLTSKRKGEAGRGGRSSEASCKVAVFGGSGFLGGFLCSELGKYPNIAISVTTIHHR